MGDAHVENLGKIEPGDEPDEHEIQPADYQAAGCTQSRRREGRRDQRMQAQQRVANGIVGRHSPPSGDPIDNMKERGSGQRDNARPGYTWMTTLRALPIRSVYVRKASWI